MPNSRSAKIKVSEMEYELLLTTRATKEIAARYGGLDMLPYQKISASRSALSRPSAAGTV